MCSQITMVASNISVPMEVAAESTIPKPTPGGLSTAGPHDGNVVDNVNMPAPLLVEELGPLYVAMKLGPFYIAIPKPTPGGLSTAGPYDGNVVDIINVLAPLIVEELGPLYIEGKSPLHSEEDSDSEVDCCNAGWTGEWGICAKAKKQSSVKHGMDDLDVLLLSASLLVTVLGIVISVFWCLPSARRSALVVFGMLEHWLPTYAPGTVSTWLRVCLIP